MRFFAPLASVLLLAAAPSALSTPSPAPPTTVTDAGPRLFAGDRMVILPRISVEVIGEGPDLVFIPGLASSRATWKATAERLRSRYRLHLVQVAGFAGELARANASGAVVVPTAEAIADYIEGAHLAPATIIGHSLGGTIALWLAENRPADVRPVLVVDALPFFARVMLGPKASVASITPMAERIRHAPALPLSQTAKMMDAMVTGAAERAMVLAWSEESDPTTITNALADDLELDLGPGLATIKAPVEILYPDNAPLGVPAGATDPIYHGAFASLPGVKLVRVDHSLHFIMLDQPAQFAAALDAMAGG